MAVINNCEYKVNAGLIRILLLKRKQLGITQRELGGKIGYSTAYISRVEKGSRNINMRVLDKWSDVLSLNIEINVKDKNNQ